MPKYRVDLGSLVTKLMTRSFVVSAPDEETAIERAKDRFLKAAEKQVYTEIGGTIVVDNISKEA